MAARKGRAQDMATETAPVEATGEAAPAAENAKPKRERKPRNVISFTAPQNLRDAVTAAAEAANQTPRVYVRGLLAQHFNIELPPEVIAGTRQKYANPEEKKAAQKAKRASRQELIKKLLAEHAAAQAAQAQATPAT